MTQQNDLDFVASETSGATQNRDVSTLWTVEGAEQIGAHECTIVNWEPNHAKPRLRFIPKEIEFLGYNPYELKSGTRGECIRPRWMCLGLSQHLMSSMVGIDAKTLYEWEQGVHRPSKKLVPAAEAFLASQVSPGQELAE